ncbi:UvrD-helicase domain-containing protein [Bhargavaea beijingensis]|uniref:UvrD-like helicase ATP-binding domain-containing protein n=1 Tax=Bhargavaea beijingensis TaxID=426756 RepID=A0ABX9ZG39_9BACL|nr:UvrD-helicase domain-containing protein [Bhargavaea beijingensis]RSK36627.1 hypothetical protein EJA12_02445 [Bhargavaea beijingensis]
MAKKLKPTLVLAGPGAGKTHHIINRVIDKIPLLDPERHLVVITYTNAATLEIKERLSRKVDIPPNVFIGTIHSFLIRFFLKPYGKLLGLLPEDVIYKGIDIIAKDKIEENVIKAKIVEKGIVPYEKVVSLSNNIMENKVIRNLISNRLQFLFVDEFQDADSGQYKIFEQIRIVGSTEIYYVGDPEQSIMSFQNKGRKIPTMENRVISKAIKNTMINKEYLLGNHRSSKTIIDFINHFHTSIKQEQSNSKNVTQNKVAFISVAEDIREIIEQFNLLCNDKSYCQNPPKSRFFLAYEGKTYRAVADEFGLIQKVDKDYNEINLLKESSNFVCDILNKGKNSITDELGIENLEYRQLCLKLKEYRSYILAEEFIAPYGLSNTKHKDFSRIIVNDYYKEFKSYFSIAELNSMSIPYYKISHRGTPEIILDCKVEFKLAEDEEYTKPYQINSQIGIFEKEIDIFIPLVKGKNETVYLKSVKVDYYTIKGEKMQYILDIDKQEERHFLITEENKKKTLFNFKVTSSNWILPNSRT